VIKASLDQHIAHTPTLIVLDRPSKRAAMTMAFPAFARTPVDYYGAFVLDQTVIYYTRSVCSGEIAR